MWRASRLVLEIRAYLIFKLGGDLIKMHCSYVTSVGKEKKNLNCGHVPSISNAVV